MQLTWTKSTMSVYKLFSVSCSMDMCSKSSSPLVNILVKIDCSRPHRTSMSRHFNLSRRLCVFGERGRGRRLCVFCGLCVDLCTTCTPIVIFAVLTVFWLFLTIFDDWYTVGTNSQKTLKTAKMTIGVPIITCLHRVRRIHKVRVRVRRIH